MSEAEEAVMGEFKTVAVNSSAATESSESQLPETTELAINVVSPDGESTTEEQPIIKKRQRIRYTKEQLLALRNSPLVKKPDALPPESEWFGDPVAKRDKQKPSSDGTLDNEKSKNVTEGLNKPKDEQNVSIAPKSPLLAVSRSPNGSAPASPRASDKLVLGPPKMNFASSSVGGLKVVEEKASASTTPRSNRTDTHRRTGDDLAYTRSKDFEPRAPRGPTGGRGFIGREALRERHQAERVAKDAATSQILNGRHTNVTRSHENGRSNRREGTSGPSRSKYHVEERSETPEWMNYNPQADDDAKKRKNGEDDEKFVDDIQAWKSKMKEQERKEKERLRSEKDRKNEKRAKSVSRADSSASWRAESRITEEAEEKSAPIPENLTAEEREDDIQKKPATKLKENAFPLPNIDQLFGPEGIDIATPLADSSAFDKFLSQHKMALEEGLAKSNVAKIPEPTPRDEGTSRFAKLFSHSTDEASEAERKNKARGYTIPPQSQPVANDAISPGAPISIATLFQSQNLSAARSMSPQTGSTEGKRMLSEDEVLQSLGARSFVKSSESREPNAEDVAGINRVLEALQKSSTSSDMHRGPINLPAVSNSSLTLSSAQPLHQHLASSAQSVLPFNDPSIIAQKPASVNKLPQPTKTEGTHKGSGPSEVYGSDSMKRINTMFVGSSIPTSVYRQLSSRSDNGSRESSASSSPAVKFNVTKSTMTNFSHSPNVPQSSTNIAELHAPMFKPPPPPPRSPVQLTQQGPYAGMIAPYSNGHNVPHSNGHSVPPHTRGEYGAPPPPLGRNIPVEQLFNMVPPRNAPPQFQQPGLPLPPHIPYSFPHQPDRQQQPPLPPQQSQPQGQQHQFSGPPLHQQQLNVPLHHPGMLPPGADIFNMPGYAQFIPNIVNSGLAPNNIPTLPSGVNLQQRGMMTLEEIERRSMGGR